jgi:hypothetical protein
VQFASDFRFLNFSLCLVTVLTLADWEMDWQGNPRRSVQPKLLEVDFRSPVATIGQSN